MPSIYINKTIISSTETDIITIKLVDHTYLKIRVKDITNNKIRIVYLTKNEIKQIIEHTKRWMVEKK